MVEENREPDPLPPVDPTKNVLDLVRAEGKHRDALREADIKFNAAQLQALQSRIDDLSEMRDKTSHAQAEILREQVAENAKLLASQIEKSTSVLSARTEKLEQFRYESGGRGTGLTSAFMWSAAAITTISTLINIVLTIYKSFN